ncbi:MAG: ATP synthase F1 subunit epsilon [Rickettsiaceae bacterium]|nr:ATP synthase F1 subunit epsilon [Rickettsiaceae bacterium]
MTQALIVKIITPSKVVLESEATMVTIPGNKGEFSVLPDHMKLVSSINSGIITLVNKGTKIKYFVRGGVSQVTGDTLNIITQFAVDLEYETPKSVKTIIKNMENNLSALDKESVEADIILHEIEKYEELLKFIEAR